MDGLAQIKETENGVIYDVTYDKEFNTFIIWMHDKLSFEGIPISLQEMKHFINTNQVQIVNDENEILKKYIK